MKETQHISYLPTTNEMFQKRKKTEKEGQSHKGLQVIVLKVTMGYGD